MPKPIHAAAGVFLVIAGMAGFYVWWVGGFRQEDRYGVWMIASMAIIGGIQLFFYGFGIELFSRDGGGDSGGIWPDCDGDGGD